MSSESSPYFAPLVTACAQNGVSRSVAFELARRGVLETFRINSRRYVMLSSLRSLPERMNKASA
jgi:hypothetical protein